MHTEINFNQNPFFSANIQTLIWDTIVHHTTTKLSLYTCTATQAVASDISLLCDKFIILIVS